MAGWAGTWRADSSQETINALHSTLIPSSATLGGGTVPMAARDLQDLVNQVDKTRVIWLMVPAASVDPPISQLQPFLEVGDVLIDGGNSYYVDDLWRAKELASHGIHHVDVGTSGGVWGLERGYCLMMGGEPELVERLGPIFRSLAPGPGQVHRIPELGDAHGTAEMGFLHCGSNGAGQLVKMVHNGIEYGLMEAYVEGLAILRQANSVSIT